MISVFPFWQILFKVVLCVSSVFSDVTGIDRLFLDHVSRAGSYIYPAPPLPPVQLDEPTFFPPLYLPPLFTDEIPLEPPPVNYVPPSLQPPLVSNDDTVVIPAQPPPQMSYLPPPSQDLVPPQVRIENMSCIHGMNFRVTFTTVNDPSSYPVVDDSAENCITQITATTFKIELDDYNNMLRCGVRRCMSSKARNDKGGNPNTTSDNMCVMIRLPIVKGVRLPEDRMVTLMCIPQKKVVSQTKHVKLGSKKILQMHKGRSTNGFVATGGSQKHLKTRIGIFRRRPGSSIFDENVRTDSEIELGEELLLRAIVNETDGWTSSQIGPVIITGLNSKRSAVLVNQQGCVNAVMKSICPKHPVKINPLITELHFRAFLFQESPQGDEMILSVRTQGCLQEQDCFKTQSCGDDSNSRPKRDFNSQSYENLSKRSDHNVTGDQIEDQESQLSFKVGPFQKRKHIPDSVEYIDNSTLLNISVFLVGLALTFLVLLWLVGRMYYSTGDKHNI